MLLLLNAVPLRGSRKVTSKKRRCAQKQRNGKLTLGLGELALLNTSLNSLVELGIKSALRRERDLVVGSDILLNSLAAEK